MKFPQKEMTTVSVGAEPRSGVSETSFNIISLPDTQAKSKDYFYTMDAETLLTTTLPPIRFVVGELLPQGLHILAGSSKIGKSWLVLWWCLQIARGEPVWSFPTEKGTVLYLCLEDSFSRIQDRLFDFTSEAPSNLHFATMANTLGEGLETQIENFIRQHEDTIEKEVHMALPNQKITALYCRLSSDDGREGESMSIENQKRFLETYAANHGFENTRFFVDDGFSGVSFDRRPAFQEMLREAEDGNIAVIITKDLSRLGRNHLEVGLFIEMRFPQLGVRYIAADDQYDSLYSENSDLIAIKNLFNEWNPREVSRKTRLVARVRGESGERVASRPPYGYRKDEADNKKIVPDEESAQVVKRIFDLCASGMGPTQIARLLGEEQIPNPTVYAYRKFGLVHKGFDTDRPCHWAPGTVCGILENTDYLGHTINLRYTTPSYKDKRQMVRPESEWLKFEDTHEPLISKDVWDIVQGVRQHKRRRTRMDEQNIFSGLIICADCGKPMRIHRTREMEAHQYNFVCGNYKSNGKDVCTAHYIKQGQLEAVILEDLRRTLWFAASREREFAEIISRKNSAETRREIRKRRIDLDTMRRRENELNSIFRRLYEDNVFGRIPDEQFRVLSAGYTEEQHNLKERIPAAEAEIERLEALVADVGRFIERAKRYTEITELTPELLRTFISKVVAHERDVKYSRSAEQKIEIHYAHIGAMEYTANAGLEQTA